MVIGVYFPRFVTNIRTNPKEQYMFRAPLTYAPAKRFGGMDALRFG